MNKQNSAIFHKFSYQWGMITFLKVHDLKSKTLSDNHTEILKRPLLDQSIR